MPRAPEDGRRILHRARTLARSRDPPGLDRLFAALRWRYDTARNEAVRALASLGRWPRGSKRTAGS